MFADLHLHSCFSDGTWTLEQLADQAQLNDIAALALTDHDTVEGCAEMLGICSRLGIAFVPGVEITTELDGQEVHVLGYYIDTTNGVLACELAKLQSARQERVVEMVNRLNALGVPLRTETVFELANCRSPGRPHVARALVQQGFCTSHDEAFERFLKKEKPAYVPRRKMPVEEGIRLIHEAGGVAVVAHPGLTKLDHLIPFLIEAGIDGIECFHPTHPAGSTSRYVAIAERHGLLVTGGSDCHGPTKGKAVIGTVRVPLECYENLREFVWRRPSHRRMKYRGKSSTCTCA